LTYIDQSVVVTTDDEGYYSATFDVHKGLPNSTDVTAAYELGDRVLSANHEISVLHPDAEYLLISDVDDTIIHTSITKLLLAAQLTFLNNSKTRKPLAGAASLYHSLARGIHADPANPMIYLSNSPWNMYDLLHDFLDLNDFPPGPLLLRDIGPGSDASNHEIQTLDQLLVRYPHLPVVLIGDSAQHDAKY